MPKLSVCITCYNQHPVSIVHIRESMNSTRVPDEIVVVNDSGTPDLLDMIKELPRKCPIHYARVNENIEWNYTGARNLAFWISSGDFVCIEDNDQIPFPDFYEKALARFEEKPEVGRICAEKRDLMPLEDVLNKPREEWVRIKEKVYHKDTNMVRRSTFIKLKGCDERFAGRYAWACSDWRRRLMRAEIVSDNVSKFYAVYKGDTLDLVRRKSYMNYNLARESDGHIQSPKGVLNFSYEYIYLPC